MAQPQGVKWCPRCERDRDRDADFTRNRAQHDGRSTYCKPCESEYGKLRYYADHANCRIRKRAAWARYARTHPEQLRVRSHRRRARARDLPATLTAREWRVICFAFDHRCAYCRAFGPLQQDHYHPLARGGYYTRDNIVPACSGCNARKRDRPAWALFAPAVVARIERVRATIARLDALV